MNVQPVTLQGQHVRLEPLLLDHVAQLFEAAQHDDIWRYLPQARPQSVQDMENLVKEALQWQADGKRIPFAIIDLATGRAIGSTSYLDILPADRGIEIGWTWLGRDYWKTARNTECKYLLMRHAFETLGAIRVQLKTDLRNNISQNAIQRIGGVKEGVLRRHKILHNGYVRDTVFFSILDHEWPQVKARLEEKLAGYTPAATAGA